MERIVSTEYERLLRKEAEMLLSFQQERDTHYDTLGVEELRRECAVQQIMLNLQQKRIDVLNGHQNAKNTYSEDLTFLQPKR